MEQTIKKISSNDLLKETNLMKNSGYRLVAITCTNKDGIELTYTFDKEFDFINLRINMDYDVEIESINYMFPYAFLYENEIKELFGVNIINMTLDFKDNLYRISVKTPFNMKKESE